MSKPVVAFALESKARANLERKVERLRILVEHGALPSDVPSSLRQFNAWEFAGNGAEDSFKRNANETLARHSDLRGAAVALMHIAKEAAKPVVRPRDIGLKRAREQAELHLKIRQIAEVQVLRARSENAVLRREIEALRAQVESMAEETAKIREGYEGELQKVRTRHAELLRAGPPNVKAIHRDE